MERTLRSLSGCCRDQYPTRSSHYLRRSYVEPAKFLQRGPVSSVNPFSHVILLWGRQSPSHQGGLQHAVYSRSHKQLLYPLSGSLEAEYDQRRSRDLATRLPSLPRKPQEKEGSPSSCRGPALLCLQPHRLPLLLRVSSSPHVLPTNDFLLSIPWLSMNIQKTNLWKHRVYILPG